MTVSELKHALREEFKRKREDLSEDRKRSAENELFDAIAYLSKKHSSILSFESFQTEISMLKINHFLEEEGKLLLPRVDSTHDLKAYAVKSREKELKISSFGLLEPDPDRSKEISPDQISLVLVPGLIFDSKCHRIGYGKGCYDRFLSKLKESCLFLGIGFREQYSKEILPVDEKDKALSALFLF
ncbi:5-formyltetrahydrofolate cyclo-ligase [Criblamydia sequanensis]|uniref:5-formyltetrahydrofolate cyclo-ligase n=1 Tax=Candidatus Criblamydia sequanensis CRIB-18 TaxID=1437425 RepID=A0A090CZN3_9BACT|nr:5-formyltetrahydrofolate cyclo-ligase [Criblamydia sequanensis]CDR34416.1 Putative 5-formyltetrahydrofolate cyclo-ligase [Criblamydia sequanensis CRIB-18]